MPNSLRSRINKLAYQGHISYEDADIIREALGYRIMLKVKNNERPFCPKCDKALNKKKIDGKHIYEFCKCCGQALMWGDDIEIK